MKAIIVAGIFLEQAKEQAAASGCSAALHRRSPLPHLRLTSRWRQVYGSASGSVSRLYLPFDTWAVQIPEPTCILAFCSFVSSHRIHQTARNGRRPPVSHTSLWKGGGWWWEVGVYALCDTLNEDVVEYVSIIRLIIWCATIVVWLKANSYERTRRSYKPVYKFVF